VSSRFFSYSDSKGTTVRVTLCEPDPSSRSAPFFPFPNVDPLLIPLLQSFLAPITVPLDPPAATLLKFFLDSEHLFCMRQHRTSLFLGAPFALPDLYYCEFPAFLFCSPRPLSYGHLTSPFFPPRFRGHSEHLLY